MLPSLTFRANCASQRDRLGYPWVAGAEEHRVILSLEEIGENAQRNEREPVQSSQWELRLQRQFKLFRPPSHQFARRFPGMITGECSGSM